MKKSLLTLALLLCTATPALALDTLEPFPEKASSVEFYLGYDGIGKKAKDGGVFTQNFQFDYGITDKFSLYLASEIAVSNDIASRDAGLTIGAYYPVLDTLHFDIDVGMEVGANIYGMSMNAKPYLELTFDLNEERTWGLYLLAGESIGGAAGEGFTLATEIDVGTYFTIKETHQILLGYSMALHHQPGWAFEGSTIAAGYNVMLNDNIELVIELGFNLPVDGEKFTMGLNAGLILAF